MTLRLQPSTLICVCLRNFVTPRVSLISLIAHVRGNVSFIYDFRLYIYISIKSGTKIVSFVKLK